MLIIIIWQKNSKIPTVNGTKRDLKPYKIHLLTIYYTLKIKLVKNPCMYYTL